MSPCRTLHEVMQTRKCLLCQLNKLFTHSSAGGFPFGTACLHDMTRVIITRTRITIHRQRCVNPADFISITRSIICSGFWNRADAWVRKNSSLNSSTKHSIKQICRWYYILRSHQYTDCEIVNGCEHIQDWSVEHKWRIQRTRVITNTICSPSIYYINLV